mgnify:CR=1 FL=1
MGSINFTQENEKRLKELFLKLGFEGRTLPGKFGANSYNVLDLMHTISITTLQGLYKDLKKEVASLEETDEWSSGPAVSSKIELSTLWKEFVYLLIGYKKYQYEIISAAAEAKRNAANKLALLKRAKDAKELEEINSLSIEELNKQIAELS